jgi:hypothetical protein
VTAKSLFSSVAVPLADSFEELCMMLDIGDNLWWVKLKKENAVKDKINSH